MEEELLLLELAMGGACGAMPSPLCIHSQVSVQSGARP